MDLIFLIIIFFHWAIFGTPQTGIYSLQRKKKNLQCQNYENVINKDSKSDPLGYNCSTNKNDSVSRFFNCPVLAKADYGYCYEYLSSKETFFTSYMPKLQWFILNYHIAAHSIEGGLYSKHQACNDLWTLRFLLFIILVHFPGYVFV